MESLNRAVTRGGVGGGGSDTKIGHKNRQQLSNEGKRNGKGREGRRRKLKKERRKKEGRKRRRSKKGRKEKEEKGKLGSRALELP